MPLSKFAREDDQRLTTAPDAPGDFPARAASAFAKALREADQGSLARLRQAAPLLTDRDARNRKKAGRLVKEANTALDGRRYKEAERLFDEAIALLDNPASSLWVRRISAASRAANHDYVVNNYPRIAALASSDDERAIVDHAWLDCLVAAGYLHEALTVAERWADRPTTSQIAIRSVIGLIHARLGDHAAAIAVQRAILAEHPENPLARWHLALAQLEAGDLPEAYENYERRFELPEFPSERRHFDFPRWNGEPIEGKRILVWREQGIGDEIRFAGILPDLIEAGADVTFECSAKLVGLFRGAFPGITVRPAGLWSAKAQAVDPSSLFSTSNEGVTFTGRPNAEAAGTPFDYHVPIGSLARFFRPTVPAMRARMRPWLKRDAEMEGRLRQAMKAEPHEPVIGICWRSSNQNMHRNHHYLKPESLAALKLLGRARFVSLQYDECRAEVGLMRELGLPIAHFTSIDQMNDLVAASRLAGACDLVISAGTATAELSAGLGIPTILFGVSGSQIQLGTDGVPWHPATRFLPVDEHDPMAVVKAVLFNWPQFAAFATENSISGRPTDWRLAFPTGE